MTGRKPSQNITRTVRVTQEVYETLLAVQERFDLASIAEALSVAVDEDARREWKEGCDECLQVQQVPKTAAIASLLASANDAECT